MFASTISLKQTILVSLVFLVFITIFLFVHHERIHVKVYLLLHTFTFNNSTAILIFSYLVLEIYHCYRTLLWDSERRSKSLYEIDSSDQYLR